MSDSLSSASLLHPRDDGFKLECSFDFPNSGITVLFGASGSGKTTVLRCIAGLERARGFVKVDGVYWQNDAQKLFLPTWERPLGYVFQEASLFPHMTAKQNIEFAVKRSKSADARSRLPEPLPPNRRSCCLMNRWRHWISNGSRKLCLGWRSSKAILRFRCSMSRIPLKKYCTWLITLS